MRLLLGMIVVFSALRPGISWVPMTAVSIPRRCAPLRTPLAQRGVVLELRFGSSRRLQQLPPGTTRMMVGVGGTMARNFKILVADKVAPSVLDELR